MEKEEEEVLAIVIIFGTLGILTVALIFWYCRQRKTKSNNNKAEVKQDVQHVQPYSKFMQKRPSDNFTIPIIPMAKEIPFTIIEENVTEDIGPRINEHYPPLSRVSSTSSNRKGLHRSLSEPAVTRPDDEVESNLGDNNLAVSSINLSQSTRSSSEESISIAHLKDNLSTRTLRTKSTRGFLQLPQTDEARKISVYKDPTVDVREATLARRRGTLLNQAESYKRAGMIHFSTEYLQQEKILRIHLHNASDLQRKNILVQVNPFARLSLVPGKRHKHDSKLFHNTCDPEFDERIEFPHMDKEFFNEEKLKIKIYSRDKIKRKELIGQVEILLSSLSLEGKESFNINLFKQRSTISMTSVGITICHQAMHSTLEVYIERLKKVPKGSACLYGAATLYKGDISISRNTTIKRYNKDPVFRETLTFQDFNTDSSSPLSSHTLVFSLVERSMLGQDHILGHVIFSMSSPQSSALNQWEAVRLSPHQSHSSWHYLLPPDDLK